MRGSNLLDNYNAQLIGRCDMMIDMSEMLVIPMRCECVISNKFCCRVHVLMPKCSKPNTYYGSGTHG